jgi:hypothetical protein
MRENIPDEESWLREALGVWPKYLVHQPVISAARWRQLLARGPADGVAPDALGVDMSHARLISVAGCWTNDETRHVEQVWAGNDSGAALNWIVERAGRRIPVLIDSMSPAAALIPELRARGLDVRQSTAGDMAKGCGLVESLAADGTLTHGGQDEVTNALMSARKRPIRDAGGWGWDRSDPTSQIHPIVAATLALVGALTYKKKSGKATFA